VNYEKKKQKGVLFMKHRV